MRLLCVRLPTRRRRCREPGRARRIAAGRNAVLERLRQLERTARRARAALGLHAGARDEARFVVLPERLAARLREQVQHGVPAARHADQIAPQVRDPLADAPVRIPGHRHAAHAPFAARLDHHRLVDDRDAARGRPLRQRAGALAARIDDSHVRAVNLQV